MTFFTFCLEIIKDALGLGYLIIYGIYIFATYPIQLMFPISSKSLKNEIILVAGANSNLTKEMCLQLSKTKAKLVLWETGDSETDLKTLKDEGTVEVYRYEVDVWNRNSIEATATRVRQEVGDVTMLINIADVAPEAKLLDQSPSIIEKIYETNLLSHFWITREFLPKMMERNHGHIVTVCSPAWSWRTVGFVPYIGSKCGINGFVESVKDELRNHLGNPKINFTTVFPTLLRTKTFTDSQIQLRYPTLFPVLDDKVIAKKIIEGVRRNQEYVYIPNRFRFICWIENFVPQEFLTELQRLFYINTSQKLRQA